MQADSQAVPAANENQRPTLFDYALAKFAEECQPDRESLLPAVTEFVNFANALLDGNRPSLVTHTEDANYEVHLADLTRVLVAPVRAMPPGYIDTAGAVPVTGAGRR